MAATGQITFAGQIVADSCTIALSAGGNNVVLPTVQASTLATSGSTTGTTDFTMAVTGCGAAVDARGITLTLTANSSFNSSNNNLLNNTAAGTAATNVGVEIAQGSAFATPIAFANAPFITPVVNTTNGAVSIPLSARYHATGAATAGAVATALNWTVNYQ